MLRAAETQSHMSGHWEGLGNVFNMSFSWVLGVVTTAVECIVQQLASIN